MIDWTEILVGIGIGSLKFGIDRLETIRLVGEPNKIVKEEGSSDESMADEYWIYIEKGIELTFSNSDNYRLVTIESEDKRIKLYGRNVVGMSSSDIINFMSNTMNQLPSVDTYSDVGHVLQYYESDLTLILEEDSCYFVSWGHLWIDENTPRWPR